METLRLNRVGRPGNEFDLLWLGMLIAIEFFLVAIYFAISGAEPVSFRHILYPFVWINIGIWIFVTAKPSAPIDRWYQSMAVLLAGGYFLVLSLLSGMIRVWPFVDPTIDSGFHIVLGSPGWAPVIAYFSSIIHLTIIPFIAIGYLALAYLIYMTVIDATRAAISGVIGFFACVGCSVPILASILGGTAGISATVYTLSTDIATGAFVLAVFFLYWRPSFKS